MRETARRRAWALAVAGMAVVLLALAAGVTAGAGALPVAVLYHRLQQDGALRNPVRARLYEVVARHPAITIQEAAERVGIARTTASYHLRILGREGLVVERTAPKTVHYYRNDGRFTEEMQLRLQALASPRTRHVARVLAERPGLQRSELALLLGITIATVNWHLRPLAERGLVREELQGRRRLLVPTDALRECFDVLAREAEGEARVRDLGLPPADPSSLPPA